MRRYLLVALWPAGLAAILTATAIKARRTAASPVTAAAAPAGPVTGVPGPAPEQAGPGTESAADTESAASTESAAGGVSSVGEGSAAGGSPNWLPELIKLGAMSCASGAVSYGVMALLGPTVCGRGPQLDERILRWTDTHRVPWWGAIMLRLGKIGDTWTTWGAAGTAAVCLAATWRERKWLPPAALGSALLVDHYATLALRHRFRRPGPPTSPGGTYPSGGCDRVVLFYGLVADLLWREFSGSPRTRVWATGTVAALAFNEAYSREYLSKHWFTDIVSGLFYGGLLLGPFVGANRMIVGPGRRHSQ